MKNIFAEKSNAELNLSFIIDFSNDISIKKAEILKHWGEEYQKRVRKMIQRHAHLFRNELKRFNDEIKMLISFLNEENVIELKQALYNLSLRDRKAINDVLNSLIRQSRVQKIFLRKSLMISSFVFVIWKNDKSRIVINLKKINSKLYSNAYSLLKQDTILEAFKDFVIFSSLDMTKSFFQQKTKRFDWWKITFVTFHWNQKLLMMSIMKLVNILEFFQHRMKKMLEKYL